MTKRVGKDDNFYRDYAKICLKIGLERKAQKLTADLETKDLGDPRTAKIILAHKKSKLRCTQYVQALNEYLFEHWDDADVWTELADVYEKRQKSV